MNHLSKEAQKVLEIIKKHAPIRSSEIIKILKFSDKTIYKHLAKLLDEQLIIKTGETPKIFYSINSNITHNVIPLDIKDYLIDQNYIYISASGEIIRGIKGFALWCQKNKFDFTKEKKIFLEELKRVQKYSKKGMISAKKIILSGKQQLYLDDIFFSDFYTIDHFGKTKLGQLVYIGKSSQNKKIIMEVANLVRQVILNVISKYNIKLICYIPPTIDRKVQFMDVFQKWIKLDLPEIKAVKIPLETKIPQKTLRKLEDRIINARHTIAVDPSQKINVNVLIIDDATGSGATLNETANKIKNIAQKKIKVFGYSIIGSYKNFNVISEV